MDLLSAYSGILKLFLMFAVGFALQKKRIINEETLTFLSKIMTWVGAPALLFMNAIEYINKDLFTNKPVIFAIPFVSIFLSLFVASACVKLFKLKVNGSFWTLFSFANTINIGLPICMSMFGEESVPFIIIYYLGNTILFWTVGAYLISKDSDHPIKFGLPVLKSVFSPPILGFLLGSLVVLLKIQLPTFVSGALDSLGGLVTPLSSIYIGAFIAVVGFKRIFKIDKNGVFVLLGRFLVGPMLTLGLGLLCGLPPLAVTVLVIMSSMPVMNFAVILATRYTSDASFSVQMMTTTSVLMMVVVPLYVYLCNLILF